MVSVVVSSVGVMNPTGTVLDAKSTLARARRCRDAARRAQTELLVTVLEWAHLHVETDGDLVATWGEAPVPLAGEGAPQVGEFCVHELAASLGYSTGSTRALLAEALELGHRLPRVWSLVLAGRVAPGRARMIAGATLDLSPEAAGFVDGEVAPFARGLSAAQLGRTVDEAMARFMPELAARRREDAAEGRKVNIDLEQVSFNGTCRIDAELDLADALDLDARLSDDAAGLKDLGSEQSLDVRRAIALGHLARGDNPLPLQTGQHGTPDRRRRDVVIYAHLAGGAITGSRHGRCATCSTNEGTAVVENYGPHLLTAEQVRQWCGRPDQRVIVRPVIDLNVSETVPGYRIPARIAEHVALRDRTCVFPFCTRPARSCDTDHVVAFDADGPPGQTNTGNLALLCRSHHRAKTHPGAHGLWTYRVETPGTYLWTSPLGLRYRRDRFGTHDLNTAPTEAPIEAPAERRRPDE